MTRKIVLHTFVPMKKNSEYEKMPKTLKDSGLSEKALHDISKLKWVVTEKIHGANFSFVYQDKKLLFAKRKEYLDWSDDFFGFQEVVSAIEDKVIRLFEQFSLDVRADSYIIYGELFGGKYPHPDVPAHPHVQAIQTGVYYSPSVNFGAFDMAYEIQGKKYYLDYQSAVAYFEKYDLFHAVILFSGKLNEVLDFDTRINSKVPSLLKLPELAANLIEGVVIKPLSHSELKDLEFRPVIKLKNPEFDEEKKFHEAEKWSFVPDISSRSEELSFITEALSAYINENRLNSAVSKIGRMDFSSEARTTQIREEVLLDAWTDFNAANGHLLDDLDISQQDWIKARISAQITALMNEYR